MEQMYYSLSDIMDELLSEYASIGQKDRDNLRKKIEKVCRGIKVGDTDLWDKSAVLKEGGKKSRHKFSPDEKRRILISDELFKYVLKHKSSEEYEEYVEAEKAAAKAIEGERVFLESEGYGETMESIPDGGHTRIDPKVLEEKKCYLMLEALYLKFFEPIDTDKLEADIVLRDMWNGLDITAQNMIAYKHLQLGSAYYCKEKKDPEDDS